MHENDNHIFKSSQFVFFVRSHKYLFLINFMRFIHRYLLLLLIDNSYNLYSR